MKNKIDIAIIGGGASGLFCSILLKTYFLKVNNKDINLTIYEAQDKIGKKILQTGNGKCNLSNKNITIANYNTNVLEYLLTKFNYQELLKILNSWGLQVRIDNEGRIYPYSEKATTVLDIFLKKIKELNINVVCNSYINDIKFTNNLFYFSDVNCNHYQSDYLVVCTGGCSSITYKYNTSELLKKLNHTTTSLYPSLCALKTKENTKALNGLKVKCKASIMVNGQIKYQTNGEVLFKDEGLSGIAIFMLSKYYESDKSCIVSLDLFPEKTIEELNEQLYQNNQELENSLLGYFPKMINHDIIKRVGKKTVGEIIKNYNFTIVDTYGFNNAQVTKGGLDLNEVDIKSFKSKKNKKLYIAGEALDVDGNCGGYNLHFAFASAFAIAKDLKEVIGE